MAYKPEIQLENINQITTNLNTSMKNTVFLFTILLTITFVQTQVIPSISTIATNLKLPLISNLLIVTNPSADCFQGTVLTIINEENTFESTYVACFVPSTDCNYNKCNKGFIVNYTSAETGLVQGFPINTQAVFILDVNSAADYYIGKSANLSPELNQIIDIACYQFDPTIASPPKPTISTLLTNLNKVAASPTPSLSVYNLLQGQKYVYKNEQQKVYIPQYSFKTVENNTYSVTAPTQSLILSQIQGDLATVDRLIKYDASNSLIQERSDIVGLNFTNNLGDTGVFQGTISLTFNRLKSKQQYKLNDLDAALANITTVYSLADLQKIRLTDNLQFKVYPTIDIMNSTNEVIPENAEKVGNLDQYLATRSNLTTEITNLRNEVLLPIINTKVNSTLNSIIGGKTSLSQIVIFNKQYPLYEKTVFGKTIKVSILVIAKLVNNQVLVITGTLKLNFFGVTKDIVVFNRSQNVNYNWSYSHTFSGSWSFNIYIPLPPPVSFLGINFGFSASYSIPIYLSSTGSASAADYYQCTFVANVAASLNVDASAAVRAIVVEGGVFISGTLVSVRTDPKLVLKYFYLLNKVNVSLSWYFYLKPFSFNWGFFWRYYKLFSGWSDRNIIAQWTISNPTQKQYLIWNFSKDYQL